ncbi:putative transposase IS891/IS1136/IS1341 family protein [Tolypothrix tenuis PCC 7101]|uniref:Putative transposase IS891/IS1136/IS1341 family protein n=1 Tax=Tolypothrix tenuis PCC 7101 TaxID=231146 RepID=A0A1Z4MSF3_9CYAN|nr:putative transposase IS891/IS1136/IS1341 family protein [Tolypothrix tenuis PCC 7101]BAY96840.1 putative transposase IS891/IS1136/IS1341 family protein [Tolypothrix tenuis PCC 7101]BAZ72652.1 putative transposase IS891/IS1136/IS1341 family protein [Aulosira laxa NIES-50]BAZ73111.1 putative transposase IS891/IS1136/IS1341 family protein [Aulosira laxa NIES-50]
MTFRLYPNKQIEQSLRYHRKLHKDLYNAAVYNRFTQYQKFNHSVSYFEQQNCLPAFKDVWTEYKEINSQALQATLKRVDFAFERWFKSLGKRPRFKSIRHYSGWTYPAKSGYSVESNGENGYLNLSMIGRIQMRGQAKFWGTPTTCTIVHRNGKWYASITVDLLDQVLKPNILPVGAIGIDLGCNSALSITDGENHQQIEAPLFLRNAEHLIKKASKSKRRKQAPNRNKKIKASRRWKKAQSKVSKITRKVANQRQNWVHQVASEIVSSNSFVATEKLEVKNMASKAKKGKRKKQKAGLNKSILDVGFGMLRSTIKYKVEQIGGVFVEVPTKKVKPSQTCPKCGHQHKKTLDIRVHNCAVCGYQQDRDIAAAEVMLYWAKGTLPGLGTSLVDAESSGSTSCTKARQQAGSMKQLGAKKRQKSVEVSANNELRDVETHSSGGANCG